MGWLVRFSVTEPAAQTELVVSELWDLGTSGVFEADDGVIVAGFDDRGTAEGVAAAIAERPVVIAGSVTVEPAAPVAAWDGEAAAPVALLGPTGPFTVSIRTGGTFGHGGHPTTGLALGLLLGSIGPERRVLDVGTGSGILAIAAVKAGAASAVAIDNDPLAVTVAEENAARNGVDLPCLLGTVADATSRWGPTFDLVVANVLLTAHRELADEVLAAVATPGLLVTTGYLPSQEDEVVARYTGGRPGLVVAERRTRDGWVGHRFSTDS